MCNACGFACCASDEIIGCGCDSCACPDCHARCLDCGLIECACFDDELGDEFGDGEDEQPDDYSWGEEEE